MAHNRINSDWQFRCASLPTRCRLPSAARWAAEMTNNMIKSFDDFKNLLAELLGQPLNQEAEVAAQDFWKNVSPIAEGVSQGTIAINVDVLRLSLAFPEYKTYQVWKGLAIFIFHFFMENRSRHRCCKRNHSFHRQCKAKSHGAQVCCRYPGIHCSRGNSEGFWNLCAHYIAGNVQLASVQGRAHWPQLPSDILTGKENFIKQ